MKLPLPQNLEHARESWEALACVAREGKTEDAKRAATYLDSAGVKWRDEPAAKRASAIRPEPVAPPALHVPVIPQTPTPIPVRTLDGPSMALRWLFVVWLASILIRWTVHVFR